VFHDDGRFVLQMSNPALELPGQYRIVGADGIILDFEWNRQSGGANGRFDGDRMTVLYNETMSLSDFEDAVYVLHRPPGTD
jgi:hypothetical protein